jgi:recombinational DNA repair protein (RecF pathway)
MNQIQDLLAKEMSRKDFLRFFLMAILAVFGVTNFLNF